MRSGTVVRPVVLGGDIGAYSLARHFHENHGLKAALVSTTSSGLVAHSRIFHHVVEPRMGEADVLVDLLHRIAPDDGTPALVLASADRLVCLLVQVRERLPSHVHVPYVPRPLLERLTDKASFSRLCLELGVPHPRTVVVDCAGQQDPDTSSFAFPVFAKAASTVAYAQVAFPGKSKGFVVASRADLLDLLRRVRGSGYRSSFVVQELIPGDDSGMRILTSYADRLSRVRCSAFGQVLLEEHAPSSIGNPAAILTDHDAVSVEHARRLLEHVGWTGWANFDLKHDPRTGESVFFELNPRLGRSNFYLAAGQVDPVGPYVREHVLGQEPFAPGSLDRAVPDHLFTVLPRGLLLRYLPAGPLRARVLRAYREGHVHDPLWYAAERDPRRLAYLVASHANQYRKFARHHPVAESRSRRTAAADR